MNYETILFEKEAGIATATLNRPHRLNAITTQMLIDFHRMLDDVSRDDEVNVLVITGAGRGFCAGEDLKETPDNDISAKVASKRGALAMDVQVDFPVKMRSMPKPIIAAVNGPAVGQGFAIALCCDMRIVSENGKFGPFWIMRGICPESAGAFHLPRLVGAAKALELSLTGRMIEAREAGEIGLANQVVPADDLMSSTLELARAIANGPPIAIGVTKQLIYQGLETDNLTTFLEREMFGLSYCFQTEDRMEGINAFLEKRAPKFRGK